MLFMCQSRSTIFPGILICVIFSPRDMQEYTFMFRIALEWTVNSICDHQKLRLATIRVAVHTNHKWIIHLLWGCGGELKIYH
jgi:hypothetical protein